MNVGDVVKLNDKYGFIRNYNNVNNGDVGFIIAKDVRPKSPYGVCIKVLFTNGALIIGHYNNFELYKRCVT